MQTLRILKICMILSKLTSKLFPDIPTLLPLIENTSPSLILWDSSSRQSFQEIVPQLSLDPTLNTPIKTSLFTFLFVTEKVMYLSTFTQLRGG